ncbi:twin-arginine translocation signal domain-containing protein [Bacteroides sp. 51]|nr:twin-arginine translocation signal domain-containing protein [Bacteroides sp. 51]
MLIILKAVDRRDFLKTVAIAGAAMSIQRVGAMDILSQTFEYSGASGQRTGAKAGYNGSR